jgi:pimeloyl-ACP methyl ester carboxylesterase
MIRRLIRSVLRTLLLVYLGVFLYARFLSDRNIFQPPPSSYRDSDQIIKLRSSGGAQISAISLPNPSARYTLLYSHGNGEDIGQGRPLLEAIKDAGFSVFAYDYQGYGTSSGTPSEQHAYRDEDAAYSYLVRKRGIPPDRIIALGRSLGGAMAVDLACRRPLQEEGLGTLLPEHSERGVRTSGSCRLERSAADP